MMQLVRATTARIVLTPDPYGSMPLLGEGAHKAWHTAAHVQLVVQGVRLAHGRGAHWGRLARVGTSAQAQLGVWGVLQRAPARTKATRVAHGRRACIRGGARGVPLDA